ncbi:MAG: endonuclease III [Myxococcales bacterium]
MRETSTQRAGRAAQIFERLASAYPEAATELDFGTPLELLVAVLLSAQCTDVRVNQVTPALFARFRSAEDFARAKPQEIEPYIKTCGLYRNKAQAIALASRAIVAEHGGQVPTSREALVQLPGIGNKSAGVISMHLSETEHAFPVDTHVARLSFRLGLSRADRPDDIERDLRELLPRGLWKPGHHQLILHGRRVCTARAPKCPQCPLLDLCPRNGLPKLAKEE